MLLSQMRYWILRFQAERSHYPRRELFSVAVVPKSVPSWVDFTGTSLLEMTLKREPLTLLSGESVALEFLVGSSGLEVGTALGTVSFGLLDSENSVSFGLLDSEDSPRCAGHDATFDVILRVTPDDELNQLGSIRAVGLSLVAIGTDNFESSKRCSPYFSSLVTICIGFGVIALGIVYR
jgi:hypothetical protein